MSSGDYFLLTLQRYNISEGHCPFQSVSVLKGAGICDGQRRYLHQATQVSAKAYEGICDEG